jgi:hypothetical protein
VGLSQESAVRTIHKPALLVAALCLALVPIQLHRRRRPKHTVPYRLVQQHLETWLARTREHDPDGLPHG